MDFKGKPQFLANDELPQWPSSPTIPSKKSSPPTLGYQSQGVKDNDIFNLPSSDWQLLGFLTTIASFVRLFRIYQPSSVVFDEVQYVFISSS
jgi:dolichyl-phosphate-mannose-protein mannosyltransferase